MAKSKEYVQHKISAAKPETVTITDGKFQPGDRVQLNRSFTVWGGKPSNTGTVRSVKREGDYEYAVVAMDPYGSIAMPPTDSLVKLEKEGLQ